jgi:hypothetical protein
MKINPLDAHDRYTYFTKQDFDIGACCQDLINQAPYGDHAFYIFAHARTEDNGVDKRMIWQPRLTKPKAQENSMLFKAYPGTDTVKVIWMLPAKELWNQFKRGTLTENKLICESIEAFKHQRAKLEAPEEDDLDDEEIDKIYREISAGAKRRSSAAYPIVSS